MSKVRIIGIFAVFLSSFLLRPTLPMFSLVVFPDFANVLTVCHVLLQGYEAEVKRPLLHLLGHLNSDLEAAGAVSVPPTPALP
jgi:hypothetical protein